MNKSNITVLHEFINNKAEYLASKYKNGQMYQDLKQEALVVGYSLLEGGVTCEKKITGAMRTRLNDFYNFEQLPVYVPSSGHTRKARIALQRGDTSQHVEWPLLQALMASEGVDQLEEGVTNGHTNHVADYEYKEYLQHLLFLMEENLTTREYEVVTSVYLQEWTQQEVADQIGVTQQRVEQLLEAGLSKIKLKLGVPKIEKD